MCSVGAVYTHIPLPLVNGGATNKSVWRRMQSSGRKVLVAGAVDKMRDRQTPQGMQCLATTVKVYGRGVFKDKFKCIVFSLLRREVATLVSTIERAAKNRLHAT